MTTIVFDNKRVYADSGMTKGMEKFQSMSKVRALKTPFPMSSKKYGMKDVVHGWACTGSIRAAEAFVRDAEHFGDIDIYLMLYNMADDLALLNTDNNFEIIFIGENALYCVRNQDPEKPFEVIKHKERIALGSGASILADILRTNKLASIIRAMYATFVQDENSGGLIDVWELRKKRGGCVFERIGVCRGLEDRNVHALTHDLNEPYPFDYVLNPKAATIQPKAPKQVFPMRVGANWKKPTLPEA